MEMIVNTVRILEHDQAKEHMFGDDKSLKENVALALINPENLKGLKLTSNSNIKISSQFGSVILKIIEDENVPIGIINIPVSIWANQLTGVENDQLIYKNLKVKVEPSNDPVLDFEDLILKIKPN